MVFVLDEPATNPIIPDTQFFYIDLSQCASLLNRRFYRQGINWAVAGFKLLSTTSASVSINKLPNTWVMANSWEKGMRTWSKMNKEAMEETESIRPRFLDFKVYANSLHQQNGFINNKLPVSSRFGLLGGVVKPGEWVSSKVVVPFGPASPGNTAEFEVMAVGANYAGATIPVVSLIEGYAASRALPYAPDPNTPADAEDASGSTPENWMSAIFNEGTDQTSEVIEDLLFDNNLPPYPFEGDGVSLDTQYPGGANQLQNLQIHAIDNITATTIGGITRLKGGNFPCGLIEIAYTPTEAGGSPTFMIDLIPGSHRGYLCESMTEM